MAGGIVVGLLWGTINVRDCYVGKTTGFLIQLGLSRRPSLSSNLVTGQWCWVYAVNPVVGVIDSIRWSALATEVSGPGAHRLGCLTLAILLFLALRFSARTERSFASAILSDAIELDRVSKRYTLGEFRGGGDAVRDVISALVRAHGQNRTTPPRTGRCGT